MRRETFEGIGTEANARRGYTLALALMIVRRWETLPVRGAVFGEILAKNRLYAAVTRLYVLLAFLQPLALFAYMVKTVVSLPPRLDRGARVLAVQNFQNEAHAIDRVEQILDAAAAGGGLHRLVMARRYLLHPLHLVTLLRFLALAPRLWPLLARLAARDSFMPAARIAGALAIYLHFSRLLERRPAIAAVVTASNYGPEAIGLAAAAHRQRRNVIYTNHAPVPPHSGYVPPVLADCALFYGEEVSETYRRHSRCRAEIGLVGLEGDTVPFAWRERPRSVGIFLTALTRAEAVEALVADITAHDPEVRIIIRNHPVSLLENDFSALAARYPNVEVTFGNPLADEIAACDMVFCGNSGVAMNVLRGGRPVVHVDTLDGLRHDYNGFIASGLVHEADGWHAGLYAEARAFYTAPGWKAVMRRYDASYEADAAALERDAGTLLARFL
ncbi:hypothetical protein [Sphingomicrobium aestuariivivum]|uniref:hypothetical protein n=1 Tax=Sphingomicrobium aestuariivivum TaxID=1582356 RepID=UPI001FD6F017|nr:hypothetical protein [Sphingomicrobium aestuariivivum]MCJ8190770.1 hypothetical protein [Sphingomicrobium aestuariivivum]